MKLILILTSLFAGAALGCSGFLPSNDLYIPVGVKGAQTGITEAEFNEVADDIYALYYPVIKNAGGDFFIDKKWKDGTVNAFADLRGSLRRVTVMGGMARAESMTKDAFALIVCHEVGHHLGGTPKDPGDSWATIEGQSDYFASLKCLRRLWMNDKNAEIIGKAKVSDFLSESCKKQKFSKVDEAICIRTGLAVESVAELFASLGGAKAAKLNSPDPKVVTQTYIGHPSSQCRIDTLFQGALCEKAFTEDVSDVDEVKGTCHGLSGHKTGLRPTCWFRPKARAR